MPRAIRGSQAVAGHSEAPGGLAWPARHGGHSAVRAAVNRVAAFQPISPTGAWQLRSSGQGGSGPGLRIAGPRQSPSESSARQFEKGARRDPLARVVPSGPAGGGRRPCCRRPCRPSSTAPSSQPGPIQARARFSDSGPPQGLQALAKETGSGEAAPRGRASPARRGGHSAVRAAVNRVAAFLPISPTGAG